MPTVHSFVLDCGMPLIVEPISGVRSASLSWLLPVGAATDPEDRQGLSPMLTELVLRGAGDLDSRQQADAFDRLGVTRSTDTGLMYLRLSASMIGTHVGAALPLLVDMVRRPRLEASAVEPTRDLALAALAGLADNPSERAAVVLGERHNPIPMNRSSYGTAEALAAITREELVETWARRVRPRSSILAIAGAVDPAAVREQMNRLLGAAWEGAAEPVPQRANPLTGTYHHERDESSQVQVYLAHESPAEPSPDSLLERVATAILSGGTSARLFTEVREKRALCYSVGASYAPDKHFGRTVAYVGTTPERAQQSLDVLVAELRRMAAGGEKGNAAPVIDEQEFARAIVGFKSGLVSSGESTPARASALATDQHRLGRPRSLEEIASKVDAVKVDDVRAYLARRRLGPMTIVTLGPAPLTPPV